MKRFVGTVSIVIFATGIAVAILGGVMIGWTALSGPKGGPHAPEGSLPGYFFGLFAVFIGLIGVAIGRGLESASKPGSSKVAAEQAVAADGATPRR
jgi:hypothetical protein